MNIKHFNRIQIELIADKYFNSGLKLRNNIITALKKLLKYNKAGIVINDNIPEFVSVSYDGGNHPEYASNLYSVVHKIYMEPNGDIVLDTEDTYGYSIDNITTEELYNLYDFIFKYKDQLGLS